MKTARKSINGVKMVTSTGVKVLIKKTFNENLGRSPKRNLKFPIQVTDKFLFGKRVVRITSRKEYNEYLFMIRIKKLFHSTKITFEPQFSMN